MTDRIIHYWDNRDGGRTLCGMPVRDFDPMPHTSKFLLGWVEPERITCYACRARLPEDRIAKHFAIESDRYSGLQIDFDSGQPSVAELRRRWAIEQAVALHAGARLISIPETRDIEQSADRLIAYVTGADQ